MNYIQSFLEKQQPYVQTNCNEVVVLQQGEHSSVHNSRPAGEDWQVQERRE